MKAEPRLTLTPTVAPAQPPTVVPQPATAAPPPVQAATPTPRPTGIGFPVHIPVPTLANRKIILLATALAALLVLDAVIRYRASVPAPPHPGPSSSFHAGGVARSHSLPTIEATSLKEAAKAIRETDRPIDEIRTEHTDRWAKERDKAFDKAFVKLLDKIIPPNPSKYAAQADPPSREQRAAYADALEDIADGELAGAK